jgi:uncharacterized membrane protein YphA (DoxX/SURF4 family)
MSVLQGLISVGGRLMIATIFLLSAVGNKIPKFNIQFMKNLSLMGTMTFLIANGGGAMSLDGRSVKTNKTTE